MGQFGGTMRVPRAGKSHPNLSPAAADHRGWQAPVSRRLPWRRLFLKRLHQGAVFGDFDIGNFAGVLEGNVIDDPAIVLFTRDGGNRGIGRLRFDRFLNGQRQRAEWSSRGAGRRQKTFHSAGRPGEIGTEETAVWGYEDLRCTVLLAEFDFVSVDTVFSGFADIGDFIIRRLRAGGFLNCGGQFIEFSGSRFHALVATGEKAGARQ